MEVTHAYVCTHTHTQVPMCMIFHHKGSRSLKNYEKENLHNLAQREAQSRIKNACECQRRMDKIYKGGAVCIILFIKYYKCDNTKATPVALHSVSLTEKKIGHHTKNPCEGFDSVDMH